MSSGRSPEQSGHGRHYERASSRDSRSGRSWGREYDRRGRREDGDWRSRRQTRPYPHDDRPDRGPRGYSQSSRSYGSARHRHRGYGDDAGDLRYPPPEYAAGDERDRRSGRYGRSRGPYEQRYEGGDRNRQLGKRSRSRSIPRNHHPTHKRPHDEAPGREYPAAAAGTSASTAEGPPRSSRRRHQHYYNPSPVHRPRTGEYQPPPMTPPPPPPPETPPPPPPPALPLSPRPPVPPPHVLRAPSAVSAQAPDTASPLTPASRQRSPAEGIQLYSRISMVGEGTYGKVYKARNKETGQVVALKRMRIDMEREGFPITAMREIRLLKQLQHPNITQVLDVVPETGNAVCVVMEYMDFDLSGLINHPQWNPDPAHQKSLMQQLLDGLGFMHTRGILHRDIKGSNLLVNQQGQVKYVDFGLARSFHHRRMQEFTNRVITLWYRPPELLLGTTLYGPEVDIWSLGCVLLELFLKKPAFQGQNDIDQLEQIFKQVGTPSPEVWARFKKLPWACYMKPSARYENRLPSMLAPKMTASAVDLICWMLALDPTARPSAAQCLGHRFFSESPAPEPPTSFPVSGDWHEYESKAERRKRKQAAKQQQQQQQLQQQQQNAAI